MFCSSCCICLDLDAEDLGKRTVSDKVLKDRAYEIELNPQHAGYQRWMSSVVYKSKIGSPANVNEVLAQELDKPVTKKIQKKGNVFKFQR